MNYAVLRGKRKAREQSPIGSDKKGGKKKGKGVSLYISALSKLDKKKGKEKKGKGTKGTIAGASEITQEKGGEKGGRREKGKKAIIWQFIALSVGKGGKKTNATVKR